LWHAFEQTLDEGESTGRPVLAQEGIDKPHLNKVDIRQEKRQPGPRLGRRLWIAALLGDADQAFIGWRSPRKNGNGPAERFFCRLKMRESLLGLAYGDPNVGVFLSQGKQAPRKIQRLLALATLEHHAGKADAGSDGGIVEPAHCAPRELFGVQVLLHRGANRECTPSVQVLRVFGAPVARERNKLGPLLFTRGTRGALAEPLTFVVGKAPAFDFKNPLPWRGKIDVLSVAMAVVDHTD